MNDLEEYNFISWLPKTSTKYDPVLIPVAKILFPSPNSLKVAPVDS